jgi:predicted unusual protein kinase regulating ubiquinone biosynthesis (AarF/ABC1/UbiB family)
VLEEQLRSVGDVVDVEIAPEVVEKGRDLLSLLDSYVSSIDLSTIPVGEVAAVSAFAAVALKVLQQFKNSNATNTNTNTSSRGGGGPTTSASTDDLLPLYYDPVAAEQYFSKRKGLVLKRVFEILYGSAEFLISLKTEGGQGVSDETRLKQATQLRELLTFLGPTFIKAGQALSIRVDLLPEVYLNELRKLQDAVPPFPTQEAYEILNRELASKGGVRGVFESITPEPVASASLGQVYRGKLKETGEEVAIKVQRPNILPSIALDLHILRIIAPIFQKYKDLNSDIVALVDQWGSRFVAELDYLREAENGRQFIEAMKVRKVSSVTSAQPVDDLCTSSILVTEWISGQRLELSEEKDVAKLCGLALTAYLTMLLDTGVLHADPHPGNLLRTDEGQLCILDWGLTTEITSDRQYAIIDYIAHLVAEDYVEIPKDLVSLGFIPRGKENAVDDQGVVRALSKVFRNLAQGGGAKGINVSDVATEVQFIQGKYGNIFQIPPYFAYILRAFSVLEGIGLQNDPKYAIVQECYPYIARRLFSDNTPRVRTALRAIMYEPSSVDGQMKLNVRRFSKLANAFRTYTDQSVSLMPKDSSRTEEENRESESLIIKEGLELIFSVEGNYLQEMLVREAARTVDTLGREALRQGLQLVTGGQGQAEVVFPFSTQLEPELQKQMEFLLAPLSAKSEDDQVVMETAQAVWEIIQPEVNRFLAAPPTDMATVAKQGSEASKLLPSFDEVGPGIFATAIRFNAALFERVSTRISFNSEK